ncbi:MAG: hypothetical protein NT069_09405, partial [Planctomycetota bacterium]|nr:hypothetical protein [Planctomycetota bacterium]
TLRNLGNFAEHLGLVACVEIARGVARNHRYLLQLINDVDHKHLRASFDPGMLHLLNDEITSEVALAKICHRVRHVRLRDSRGLPGVRDFPVLVTGDRVSFLRIHLIMRDCGYKGPFTIALEGPPNEADLPLDEYRGRISASLAYLRRLGF